MFDASDVVNGAHYEIQQRIKTFVLLMLGEKGFEWSGWNFALI
jgi:hypothetical protein